MSRTTCSESCFHYDETGKGCSYLSSDFEARESVEPGQRCLHPEFDERSLVTLPLMVLCNSLARNYVQVKK